MHVCKDHRSLITSTFPHCLSSWSVDHSEESPAKRAKLSTSLRPEKMKTSKKNKNKKRKDKKHTEDASKKQKEEDTEVTAVGQGC